MIRWLVTFALLGGTALYVHFNPPVDLAVGRGALATCPTSFGDWNGTELSFEDAVVEDLAADDLLIRRYERGHETVWLCVVYHQNRRYGAHDPRVCFESQGYLLEPVRAARIADGRPGGLEVNRFVAERGKDKRVVYYWWTTRGLATANAEAFRRAQALGGALDNRSWGAFVRVEAKVRDHNEVAADSGAVDFASRVARALPQVFAASETRALP